MAAAIARAMLPQETIVESAGLDTVEGMPATREAITAMAEIGLDIASHRSRPIGQVDLVAYDKFVALTPDIAKDLRRLGVPPDHLVSLAIEDPCGKGLAQYIATRKKIYEALVDLLSSLMTPGGT